MNITFIRHTEVIKEYQHKYNGHIDIPLSQKGLEDAKKLAQKITKNFDITFCSDLKRTKQTLKHFTNITNICYTKELREKSWGKHEGMSFEQIEKTGIKYTTFLEWINSLDGESYEDFKIRIKNFFDNLQKQNYKNVLIVTHSGVIKMFLHIYKNIPLEEAFSYRLDYGDYLEYQLTGEDSELV